MFVSNASCHTATLDSPLSLGNAWAQAFSKGYLCFLLISYLFKPEKVRMGEFFPEVLCSTLFLQALPLRTMREALGWSYFDKFGQFSLKIICGEASHIKSYAQEHWNGLNVY